MKVSLICFTIENYATCHAAPGILTPGSKYIIRKYQERSHFLTKCHGYLRTMKFNQTAR